MKKQPYRQIIFSLSTCSIPVMLAVLGSGAHASELRVSGELAGEASIKSMPEDRDLLITSREDQMLDAILDKALLPATNDHRAQRLSSWLCVAPDQQHFWVSDGTDTSISTYRFSDQNGSIKFIEKTASITTDFPTVTAEDSWVDLMVSDDGDTLYQVLGESGDVAVYDIDGESLSLLEVLSATDG